VGSADVPFRDTHCAAPARPARKIREITKHANLLMIHTPYMIDEFNEISDDLTKVSEFNINII
jgi:hypothetical protein